MDGQMVSLSLNYAEMTYMLYTFQAIEKKRIVSLLNFWFKHNEYV